MFTATASRASARERAAFLYAIRGWAILGVVAVHLGPRLRGLIPAPLELLLANGHLAVGIFFMLSMIGLTLATRASRLSREVLIGSLAIRRMTHLAPLFWLVIGLTLLINGCGPSPRAPEGIGPGTVALTLLFLHGWLPSTIRAVMPGGWYLAVDAMMLLTLPLLLRYRLSARRMFLVSIVVAAAGAVLNLLVFGAFAPGMSPGEASRLGAFLYFWFPNQFCVILLGGALYSPLRAAQLPDRIRGRRWLGPLALSLLGVAVLLMLPTPPFFPVHYLVALCFAVTVVSLARYPVVLAVNPVTCLLGRLSYSIFLTHFLVLDLVPSLLEVIHPTLRSHPRAWVGSMVGMCYCFSILLGMAAARWVEQPSLRLGRRVSSRFEAWGRRRWPAPNEASDEEPAFQGP